MEKDYKQPRISIKLRKIIINKRKPKKKREDKGRRRQIRSKMQMVDKGRR